MNPLLAKVESVLAPVFKGLPPLPKNAKETLVKIWPALALIFGLLQLFAAWGLWHLGHTTNQLADYANQLAQAYGVQPTVHHLGLFYWIGLLTLAADGLILLAAYPGLKAKTKAGWNMLLLSALVNLAYGIFIVFDDNYGGFGKLISSLIGSAIGFYLIFQVRDFYGARKAATSGKASSSTTSSRHS
ncbi:MAG TPA: hypothetical protein VLF60_04850 [Candidatus Saccharimonadales bacterium]|nr:hypothetical protein [Candidatus Saccharimonadales bacterium]